MPKTVVVLVRETTSILPRKLREGNNLIKHHKPAQPWVTFVVFGRFTLHTDGFEKQGAILLEMQIVPSADPHRLAFAVLLQTNFIGASMSLFALSLQNRPVFRKRSTFMDTHWEPIEIAIASAPYHNAVTEFMASSQEIRCGVSSIG